MSELNRVSLDLTYSLQQALFFHFMAQFLFHPDIHGGSLPSTVLLRISSFLFFNCYFAAPRPTLGHYREGSLTHLILITCVLHIRPKGPREPHNEVGSLRPAIYLVGFKQRTIQFWSQHLNPLCHSPPFQINI